VGLNHNEVQSHMSPGKVGKLELVVTGLKRGNKEDKTWFLLA
jgi:hypothetical protein